MTELQVEKGTSLVYNLLLFDESSDTINQSINNSLMKEFIAEKTHH